MIHILKMCIRDRKFAQLWQIEMREVPLTLDKTTLDPEEALKMCDENTICICLLYTSRCV